MREGGSDIIRPSQMTEADILRPNWPRADLNLACYELLVGLVAVACPPKDEIDWEERTAASSNQLDEAFARLVPAFNLIGQGPKFMQDYDGVDGATKSVDFLFIDSAGDNTIRKNADLMVHGQRYASLDLPMAAMALFTLQTHAPAGGAGNRTSLRGGGPMVTLVKPRSEPNNLWHMIWANVPLGRPFRLDQLDQFPWMRPTVTSETKPPREVHQPGQGLVPESIFSMPRRIELVEEGGRVTGARQLPYGTNYGLWRHPFSPYRQGKPEEPALPLHPRPGRFSYVNWSGVSISAGQARSAGSSGPIRYQAQCVVDYFNRAPANDADIIVAGWSTNNMTPVEFIWEETPLFNLSDQQRVTAEALVAAAEYASSLMLATMTSALGMGAKDATPMSVFKEQFYLATEDDFVAALGLLTKSGIDDNALNDLKRSWLASLRSAALSKFDSIAVDGLHNRSANPKGTKGFSRAPAIGSVVEARRNLQYGLSGKKIKEICGYFEPETKVELEQS